jgi:hypothetical protein
VALPPASAADTSVRIAGRWLRTNAGNTARVVASTSHCCCVELVSRVPGSAILPLGCRRRGRQSRLRQGGGDGGRDRHAHRRSRRIVEHDGLRRAHRSGLPSYLRQILDRDRTELTDRRRVHPMRACECEQGLCSPMKLAIRVASIEIGQHPIIFEKRRRSTRAVAEGVAAEDRRTAVFGVAEDPGVAQVVAGRERSPRWRWSMLETANGC